MKHSFAHFVGASANSLKVKRRARCNASSDTPVLLLGETGTGKELLARAIHNASPRSRYAFISISSAAIAETLLEAELFGRSDRHGRPGKLTRAQGGTLFLDEIQYMPLPLQGKLLRLLEERRYRPAGSSQVLPSDIRIIAATSSNLETATRQGTFRADLHCRLNALPIQLLPLRERLEDLPAISEAILDELRSQHELDNSALALLARHAWPGNVRELRNVLERAALLSDSLLLDARTIQAAIGNLTLPAAATCHETFSQARQRFDRQLIEQTLRQCSGNVLEAASLLGLGRSTLYKKMAALSLTEP